MGEVIRVNHPTLTSEERNSRMEQIKEAAIRFYKEVKKNEEKSKNRVV